MSIVRIVRTAPPTYTIEEDEPRGVVRMTVKGFFDRETLTRHFADNGAFVLRWRARGWPIRVLINAIDLHPHTPEVQALVESSVERIYAPGDRVAILVSSNLVKMQMRRTHTHNGIMGFFTSDRAAMTWLHAPEAQPAAL